MKNVKNCGCHLNPVNDETEPCDLCSEATETFNGIGWRITHCSLHAAAPEMLEALEEIVIDLQFSEAETHKNLVTMARAAIAKVKE